jgi:ubiquinone/menaquinone biosynthesis C-methylase UbiE
MSLSIKYWFKNCAGYIKLLDNTDNYPAPYTKIAAPVLESLVDKLTKKNDALIDLGCGEGYMTRRISATRRNIVGIDLSPEMISAAIKQNKDIEYHQIDLEKSDRSLPSSHFDLAFSTLVFMYLERVDIALKNTYRWLKPGGHLIITITHPCFYQQENFSWFQSDTDEPYNLGNYFNERTTIRNIADKFKTHHIHRTLGNYVRTFSKNGFILQDILEPKSNSTATMLLKKATKVPVYIVFVLQKPLT